MELTGEEKKIQEQAIDYVKEHKGELLDCFVISKNPLCVDTVSLFMAGSPGAGKTEFSRRYLPIDIKKYEKQLAVLLGEKNIDIKSIDSYFIKIDVDEIREFFPQYQKTDIENNITGNAHIIQKAAGKGLDIIRKYCFDNHISFLHDGTFGNYPTMKKLIKKSLKAGRDVQIFYLYLDPVAAWNFTKAREYLEGRNIIKEKFIEQYFDSKENVDKTKKEFGDEIKVHCVLKNSENNEFEEIKINVPNIEQFLKTQYNKGTIKRYSKEELSALIF